MTEEEWLTCGDPHTLLEFLRGKVSDRKLRLFACACVRRVWHLLEDDRSKEAVEVAENFADGFGYPQDRELLCRRAGEAAIDIHDRRNEYSDGLGRARMHAAFAAEHAAMTAEEFEGHISFAVESVLACSRCAGWTAAEPDTLVALLRDIFGNPFRPATVDPAWLTSDVAALAEGIYAESAFDRMPILADALQDAGCDGDDILSHCRDANAAHVRGCWVIDLLTGRV